MPPRIDQNEQKMTPALRPHLSITPLTMMMPKNAPYAGQPGEDETLKCFKTDCDIISKVTIVPFQVFHIRLKYAIEATDN